ncbi:unnamed protein product [Vicia faba]|uniref:Uncharacterized protein n=1 Tax=Vicia faba TaxID=3906 RepID=A0AAV0YTU2_VICFA|nr:unnamed protein product [Vicia faba]
MCVIIQAIIKPQYVDHIPKGVQGNVGKKLKAAQVVRSLLRLNSYVIVIEHDLIVLDYLSNFINCLYVDLVSLHRATSSLLSSLSELSLPCNSVSTFPTNRVSNSSKPPHEFNKNERHRVRLASQSNDYPRLSIVEGLQATAPRVQYNQ